jgi:hypothetical protein
MFMSIATPKNIPMTMRDPTDTVVGVTQITTMQTMTMDLTTTNMVVAVD